MLGGSSYEADHVRLAGTNDTVMSIKNGIAAQGRCESDVFHSVHITTLEPFARQPLQKDDNLEVVLLRCVVGSDSGTPTIYNPSNVAISGSSLRTFLDLPFEKLPLKAVP